MPSFAPSLHIAFAFALAVAYSVHGTLVRPWLSVIRCRRSREGGRIGLPQTLDDIQMRYRVMYPAMWMIQEPRLSLLPWLHSSQIVCALVWSHVDSCR